MIVVYQMKGIDVGKLIQAFKSNFKYNGRGGRPPYQIIGAPRGIVRVSSKIYLYMRANPVIVF